MEEAGGETDESRTVLSLTGADVLPFLQGIVSNDVLPLGRGPGLVWAALLTPQGKYLADFLIARAEGQDAILLDIHRDLAAATTRRLAMYRLRADVKIAPTDLSVTRGLGPAPQGALADPRHPDLGWRAYGAPGTAPRIDWDAIRVAHVIPESLIELIPDETYLLEAGFDRLHGVDFRKGCYVGQEVTARMKHKTELKKGFVRVRIEGEAPMGAEITADGKPAGTLFTRSGGQAIAYLRFDRAGDEMRAAGATLRLG
ncbi:MAG: folate-binding protein [Paracoccaceae bacterium]